MLRARSPGSLSEPDDGAGFRRDSRPIAGWQRLLNAVIACALAAAFVVQLREYAFIGDDAFISFRYARNLVDGVGLVWNAGEAVEGYTNFLWVLLMAAGMAVGIEPEHFSFALGIASGFAVLACLVWWNARRSGWRQPLIWLAPAALVSSRSFAGWSTSGLETQLFALAVLVAFVSLTVERDRGDRAPWRSAVLFALAALIRPEGVLFAAVAGGCLVVDSLVNRRGLRDCVGFALPLIAIVGVHLLWRHGYYGYWLPNTFYAKVHGLWWDQSAKYFGHFFADYRLHWFLPLALVSVLLRRRFGDCCLFAAVASYGAYVVYIGGDRFEFRFLVVVLPLVYTLVSDGLILLARLAARGSGAVRVAATIAVAATAVALVATTLEGSRRPEAIRTRDSIVSFGAIHAYATRRIGEGKRLRGAIEAGLLPADLRVAVTGAGALPYFTMWPAVDIYGLNDATIAHQPVRARSHVGHELRLPPGYLAEREIVVVDVLNQLVFGTDPMRLSTHLRRARRIAKSIRLSDAAAGYMTPARAKCLRISEDRVMVFVTVVSEAEFERALGGLEPCDPEEAADSGRPNFLFVLVDTLRADHTSAYGYARDTTPALSRLAAEGTRFDRAYAPAPWTKPSVAAMFTGRYPHRHGLNFVLDTLPPEAVTLAERLQKAGYATAGAVSHVFVAGKNGFDQGFAHYDSAEAGGHSHISTNGVTRRAKQLLQRVAGEPFFLFVHYFDPHYEYRRHPSIGFAPESAGRLRGGEDIHDLRALGADLSAEEVGFLRDVYDEEVRFTDDGIAALLAALEAAGLADDTIVIVAADHGEEFFERGWLGHTRTVKEEVIRVPLVFRVPGEASRVVAGPVSLVSIAPTVLDYAGVAVPKEEFQAPSLRPLIEGRAGVEVPPVRSEVQYVVLTREGPQAEKAAFKYALIRGRHKLIKDFTTNRFEVYDLEADPGERRNLAAERPELLRELLVELERTHFRDSPPGGRPAAELDPNDAQLLRDLGYIDD